MILFLGRGGREGGLEERLEIDRTIYLSLVTSVNELSVQYACTFVLAEEWELH